MGEARRLADRWWELFEAGDLDRLPEVSAADVDIIQPGGIRLRGPEQLRPVLEIYRLAFPDLRHEVVSSVETDDAVAMELRILGTNTGPVRLPTGEIPATGKPFVWESVDIVRVKGGKIASWHTYFDQVPFLVQLGLMPAPA
jgi:steroid delta-isomerase-like uncharacterized protein